MAKKKKGGHEHHGGAWKVAYADFVTAMMALFMVLWITSQSEEVLESTASYFQNPMGAFSPIDSKKIVKEGDSEGNTQQKQAVASDVDANSPVSLPFYQSVKEEFYKRLNIDPKDKEAPIEVTMTDDGLRITLYDQSKRPLFIKGTDIFTDWGMFVMQNLSWIIDRYPLNVRIDGHTPSGLELSKDYGPWELTADRANATRRALVRYALSPRKIKRISGHGDTELLPEVNPQSERNQRIELSLVVE